MLKAVAVVAVPSVLGGVGLLYGPDVEPGQTSLYQSGYAVEVGVTFAEASVRGDLFGHKRSDTIGEVRTRW